MVSTIPQHRDGSFKSLAIEFFEVLHNFIMVGMLVTGIKPLKEIVAEAPAITIRRYS